MANDDFHFYEPAKGHGLPHDPFNAMVGPRPIGWISSQDANGVLNLAPYSFFNAFNYTPPIVGFAVAVAVSLLLAPARIAAASGLAFIASQLLDIRVFDRLRRGLWWRAPLVATVIAAVLDSIVFWGIAFAGTEGPWFTWALGDLAVKLAVGVLMLLPFRLLIGRQAARASALGH